MSEGLGTILAWWREGRLLSSRSRDAWQSAREEGLLAHLRWVEANSPFYRGQDPSNISAWPTISKSDWMEHFDRINTKGLDRKTCEAIALRAERERDFSPTLESPATGESITVGLSSGTSGSRGLFVASPSERALWAGVILRRILPDLFRRRHRIALVLRSDSNLYRTLGKGHVEFRHHDLYAPWEDLAASLERQNPTLIAAPPSVLGMLARRGIAPRLRSIRRILSVAEVLEPDVERDVRTAFGVRVEQIYQCTEGLLATPCPRGTLHLHEEHLIIEPEWLDDTKTRFRPILTDFRRRAQPVIRYRLNDILVAGHCDCGRQAMAIARVEGRCDDILRVPGHDGTEQAIFPDFVRRLMLENLPMVSDWSFTQIRSDQFRLDLADPATPPEAIDNFRQGWIRLCTARDALPGVISLAAWSPPAPGAKLRRVIGTPSD